MIRSRTFRCMLSVFTVALAVGLLAEPVCAQQTGDPVQARTRPLIVVDGVILQGSTATEQESVLKLIRPAAFESIQVLKGAAAMESYGAAANDGVIVIRLKPDFAREQRGAASGATRDVVVTTQSPAPLVFIDGVEVPTTVLGALAPQDIERIEVIKGAAASAQFGERGRDGVIIITIRKR